jgi:hypothetical protein
MYQFARCREEADAHGYPEIVSLDPGHEFFSFAIVFVLLVEPTQLHLVAPC